jgi:hypothetical protein
LRSAVLDPEGRRRDLIVDEMEIVSRSSQERLSAISRDLALAFPNGTFLTSHAQHLLHARCMLARFPPTPTPHPPPRDHPITNED